MPGVRFGHCDGFQSRIGPVGQQHSRGGHGVSCGWASNPWEALAAATVNGAAALQLQQHVGGLAIGQRRASMLTRPLSSVDEALYAFGDPLPERVLLRGRWVR